MIIDDTATIAAPLDAVWALLQDVPRITPCIPGAKLEETVEEGKIYKASLKVKVGPVSVVYNATITIDELDSATHKATLLVKAGELRGRGGVTAKVAATAEAAGESETKLHMVTDANVSGAVAAVGGRLIEGVAKKNDRGFCKERFHAARMNVTLQVNGVERTIDVEPRMLLVQALRQELGLTGTHIGCDTSSCGACTVLLDGVSVKSCTMFAVQVDGCRVTTIEGIGTRADLHPMQEAFWTQHGLQCGFCTPGMIMAAVDLIARHPDPTEAEIRLGIEGNICRCTGYENIVKAVTVAAAAVRKQ